LAWGLLFIENGSQLGQPQMRLNLNKDSMNHAMFDLA